MVKTTSIELYTRGDAQVLDITTSVAGAVQTSGVTDGIVTVFCPGATGAVTTIEFEVGVLQDFQRLFDEIINPDRDYAHNTRMGDGNGHSHVRAALLGPSLTVPFAGGRLLLGTWQHIVFVDFDNCPRHRDLVVQIMGE